MIYCENGCGKGVKEKEVWSGWAWYVESTKDKSESRYHMFCGNDCAYDWLGRKVRDVRP